MNRLLWLGAWAGLALLQPGCALTSKGEALSPRYFNPRATSNVTAAAASQRFELRLGQISAAANLDERMAYRVNAAEVGFYDDRRWTEPPETYLRRALEKDLFEQRKLTRIVSGIAPVLDVELTAFEEQRGSAPQVRVTLTFSLRDERRSLLERTLEIEEPLGARGKAAPAEEVAQALVDALQKAVATLGAEVVQSLAESAAADARQSGDR